MSRWVPSQIPDWPDPWDPAVELDWGDPEVSRRLLAEHLDQRHDGASRRLSEVDRHVRRLTRLLPSPPARLLDAGCGPGLYAVRLAAAGYEVVGVDLGAAVLEHGRALAAESGVSVDLRQGDLLEAPLGEGYDAALLVYFVVDGFPPRDGARVLRRVARSLRPGGRLIAELRARPDQPPGRVTNWDVVERSLLSDDPHLLLVDTIHDQTRGSFVLREIALLDDGRLLAQQTSTRIFDLEAVPGIVERAGLRVIAIHDGWTRHRATALSDTLLVVAQRAE
ncbi:MAG: class I SAM-dependent methyltransferase [Candidatus Dormibacteria bacterium]